MIRFALVTLATAITVSATQGPTGATGGMGFPLADINDQTSPTRVVLDTFGTIETDATRDLSLQTSYLSVAALCNSTIDELEEQVAADASLKSTEHNVLNFDVNRIAHAEQMVDRLETKLAAVKNAAHRANQTLFDLEQIRVIQRTFFQSHTDFLGEVHTDILRLHDFLDAPPSHLSKANAPSAQAPNNAKEVESSLLQLSTSLQRRQQEHVRQARRLRHSQQALLRSSTHSEPPHSVRVTDITDLTPEPPSFHSTFHTSLDQLTSFLSNATEEHTTSQEQSHAEYSLAYDTLNTEAALQRGKITRLKASLDHARGEHRAAVTVMNHMKASDDDTSKDFFMKSTKAALSSLRRQCLLMQKGQELRQKHRKLDVEMAENTKVLMMDIVNEMNGKGVTGGATGGEETGGATGGEGTGSAMGRETTFF